MKIIHRYILNEMKYPVIFGISLFTFIFLIDIMVKMMENLLVKGTSFIDMFRMLSFYLPPILAQTMPLGFFLGIIITFSKLTKTSESTAMSASGMSINEILKLPLIFAGGITVFIFFLQESIIPRSFVKLQKLTYKIAYENPTVELKEKMYMNSGDGYSFYIDTVNASDNSARNFIIFKDRDENGVGNRDNSALNNGKSKNINQDKKKKSNDENKTTLSEKDKNFSTIALSKKAYWEDANMILHDTKFYQFNEIGKEKLSGEFQKQVIPINSFFDDMELKLGELEIMPVSKLLKMIKKQKTEKDKLQYKIEMHKKIALPLSTAMLAVLGVVFSLGHHRSGKSVSLVLALIIIFAYITLINLGVVMANKGSVTPFVGIWFANLLLALLTSISYLRKVKNG